MLLKIDAASVQYQKVAALKGISMGVPEGGIVTIIGANGAGKSTTLRAVSGLVALSGGEIWFADRRIDGTPPERIVAAGIAHVPEGRRIFPDLTVQENLSTGAFLRTDKDGIARDLDMVFDHFPRLKERRSQWGKTLSGGEQQMLAIGRALMSNPKLLLLDEPSMGLSPIMVQEIAGIVLEIRKRGVPVILVEQNAELALRLADYAYVLEIGSVALEGPAEELHENDHVRRAYLGGDGPDAGLPDAEALARAGWSEAELTWEQIQEAAAEAQATGDWQQATSLWAVALELARETFEAADPRLATSLANQAVAQRRAGEEAAAAASFDEALAVWACSGPWVLALAPERRARSSTYHLRLETRYPRGYDRHARARHTALAEEGYGAVRALKAGGARPRGALPRWRIERPPGYVDVRKLLAAVLLLADPMD